MADTIAEQIAVKVKDRLEQINTTDGYENAVSQVIRPTRLNDDFQPLDYTLEVEQAGTNPNTDLDCPGNPPAKGWDLVFNINAILRPDEDSTTAADTFRNQFWGDVIVALADVDSGDWRQWDGLAINTDVGTATPYQGSDGADSGFQVVVTISFRTDEDDPFVLRG